MTIKEKFEVVLKMTDREGIKDLLEWMEESGFYDAPCSTKYHLSTPGGLAEHSLNVFTTALDLVQALKKKEKVTFEYLNSVCICSLLHDIGKVGQFEKSYYRTVPEMHKGESFAGRFSYEINKDLLPVPHEIRSIAILSRFIELTEEEQFAILYHNGLYGELKSFKGKETPLYMIIHFADMWASRVIEKEEE